MAHTVTLVAGKTTWARVYLSAESAIAVRGVLTIRNNNTGAVTTVSSGNTITINPAQYLQLRPKRETLNGGLYFVIPATVIANPASLTFTLTTVTIPEARRACARTAAPARAPCRWSPPRRCAFA